MRIVDIRTVPGPNVYTYDPVLIMRLDLQELADRDSFEFPGFAARLLRLLPGLWDHVCAMGRPGGFVERLYGGTYFGHIVEHVALELSAMAGIPANFGKTRVGAAPAIYNVVVEYKAEHGMRYLLRMAVELVDALAEGESFPLAERLDAARHIVADTELGPSTGSIVEAAKQRGIPCHRLDSGSLVQLGTGKYRRLILAAMTDGTSGVGVDVASDKSLTKALLDRASVPVPYGVVVSSREAAVDALEEVGGAVAVKPLNGHQGKGVSLDLTTPAQVAEAFDVARQFAEHVVVEECVAGRNYRVLVVDGKMVAASERLPAHVTGDGTHTLAELVDIANQDPRRGDGHEKPLTRLKIDAIATAFLTKRGLTAAYVPQPTEVVFLRDSANLSTGGTAVDVTDLVHPTNAALCERAARTVGLDICGVDVVTRDIGVPIRDDGGAVVEINAAPGLRMHLHPSNGQRREVGEAIVDMLFPPSAQARIPIVSITGTNGKTTTTRMIAHILAATGLKVGMTTTEGIFVGGECIARGDMTGPHSARTILSDPQVEAAVLETARGGIIRNGLGYDWSDISIVTNVQIDHIGQDGIESIDDLVHVKSLVAERVREGGTLILNADDDRSASMAELPRVTALPKKIVYFTLNEDRLLVKKHVAEGGTAYVWKGDWIVEVAGKSKHRLARVAAIPAAMGATAEFQVANVLAAVAACRAYGLEREEIAAALATFEGQRDNPGRAALYRAGPGYVLVDYGHNPAAIEATGKLLAAWHSPRITAVAGLPGDRADQVTQQAASALAHAFDRIIIREDKDLRGRQPGELPRVMEQAIRNEFPNREYRIILDEREAVATALEEMLPGEVVVIFYEELDSVLELLQEHGAVPEPGVNGIGMPLQKVA